MASVHGRRRLSQTSSFDPMHRSFPPPALLLGLAALSVLPGCSLFENEQPEPLVLPAPRDVADDAYVETESGLKYFDFALGEGAVAETGDRVTVHYNGWIESSGEMFESSVIQGRPFSFVLGEGGVIAGWDEGVQGMRVGGERQLVIPPELGYGGRWAGQIPPGSTLIFELVVVDVAKPEPT